MKATASDGGICPRRASVAISWCFPGDPTENTAYNRSILMELMVRDAIVPEIWAFEIANNIFVSHRKRMRINEQQIAEYLSLLKALPIRVESQPLWTNVGLEALSRRWDLAAYDASYLALALRKRIPLAPSDEFLRSKALDEGVEIRHKEITVPKGTML
jgi:predicted nucleic acid-binding protein